MRSSSMPLQESAKSIIYQQIISLIAEEEDDQMLLVTVEHILSMF